MTLKEYKETLIEEAGYIENDLLSTTYTPEEKLIAQGYSQCFHYVITLLNDVKEKSL